MAMAKGNIEIKFTPRGDKTLIKAIKELHIATQKLNNQLKTLNKVNVKVAKTQSLVTQRVSSNTAAVIANSTVITKAKGVIALYRNTLLLAAFAMGLVTKVLINQVRAFSKQEDSVRRLADVFGGEAANSLDDYSSKLQENSNFADENIKTQDL